MEGKNNHPYSEEIKRTRKLGIASVVCGVLALICIILIVFVDFWACIGAFGFGLAAIYFSRVQQRKYYTNVALTGRIVGMLAVGITLVVAVIYLLFVYLFIPFLF